jgi:hypothetical protein
MILHYLYGINLHWLINNEFTEDESLHNTGVVRCIKDEVLSGFPSAYGVFFQFSHLVSHFSHFYKSSSFYILSVGCKVSTYYNS